MELISNPNQPWLMALDMNDSIKFLHIADDNALSPILTRDDYMLKTAELPSMPQPVDSYVVKCMTWCSSDGEASANALAVGLSSGKVILLWPDDQPHHNNTMHASGGFIPHVSRACTSLSWNETQQNLLATGLERCRSENSLLIWDLTSAPTPLHTHTRSGSNVGQASGHKPKSVITKPFAETCFAEAVNSVAWARHEQKTLIAGVSSKILRVYDIRNVRSVSSAVSTKSVFGVCADPCFDMRYASFFDNHIHVWDLRNFTKPAATITASNNILKVEWCPTRSGLLATVSSGVTEGRIIHVYDMTHAMGADSDSDVSYRPIKQIVKPELNYDETICTFAWMTEKKNKLIAVTNAGTLHNINVHERISLAWTRTTSMLSASQSLYQCNTQNVSVEGSADLDIEQIMFKRATNGYGLEDCDHHSPDINLEPDNHLLHAMWKWIKATKEEEVNLTTAAKDGLKSPGSNNKSSLPTGFSPSGNKFAGLQSELATQNGSSSCESVQWVGVPSAKCTIYTSPHRAHALRICGWSSIEALRDDDTAFRSSLMSEENVEKAAAIALWHLDMRLAIDILQRSAQKESAQSTNNQTQYSIIAMALSGYTGNNMSSLWREMCATLQKSLPSPYLRTAFAFLDVQDNGSTKYKEIFNTKGISTCDLAGFACTYLPDDQLLKVVDSLSEAAAKNGDLGGVMISGLITDRGIELLQNYVDKTKDVQTAALAMIQTKWSEMMSNPKAAHMLEGYRSLLNNWMLWKERASLDLAVGAGLRTRLAPQGMFVQCNYCGKSIRNNTRMGNLRGRAGLIFQASGMMSKVTSCPNCRKPLPRCSVCCMCLGTSPTGLGDSTMPRERCDDVDLDNWFTWCPLCQHGGHTKHLITWFEDHQDCPLSGFSCRCWSLINSAPQITI